MIKRILRPACILFLTAALCACGSGAAAPSDYEASITSAAMTAARIVSPVTPSPTATSTQTPLESPALSPTNPPSPAASRTVAQNLPLCDSAAYVSDVTIPDGTVMDPGEEFVKTWKMRNIGSCAWTTSYTIAFVSGNAMDGVITALTHSVEPGETADISVNLAAPAAPGKHTGYWRLKNDSGDFFGDPVYVQIVVPGGGTTTPTEAGAAATNTETPTVTETTASG